MKNKMTPLPDSLRRTKIITFDCYGTLIDWREGLMRSFCNLFGEEAKQRMDELFPAYLALEAEVEGETFRPYRGVLTEVSQRLASQFGFSLPADRVDGLARMLPDWPPFPDTCEALLRLKRHYRLGVLSNIDRDLFAETQRHLGVEFDVLITAEDVGAYKPSSAHFERLLREYGSKEEVLHVAQSLFHDGAPAAELDIAFVWINRYKDANETDVRAAATFPDLKSLADSVIASRVL